MKLKKLEQIAKEASVVGESSISVDAKTVLELIEDYKAMKIALEYYVETRDESKFIAIRSDFKSSDYAKRTLDVLKLAPAAQGKKNVNHNFPSHNTLCQSRDCQGGLRCHERFK